MKKFLGKFISLTTLVLCLAVEGASAFVAGSSNKTTTCEIVEADFGSQNNYSLTASNEKSQSQSGLADGIYDISSLSQSEKVSLGVDNYLYGYIKVDAGKVNEYSLYQIVDGKMLNCTKKDNSEYSYSFAQNNFYNVANFGATGDGVTDDTVAIMDAVEAVKQTGGILYFPTANYKVSILTENSSLIYLNTSNVVLVDFMGSTLTLCANGFYKYNIVKTDGCNNVIIQNGNIIGDKEIHDYSGEGYYSNGVKKVHDEGIGIYFYNVVDGMAFNMNIGFMTGDSIKVRADGYSDVSTNGTVMIDECDLHDNRRQGVTILNSYIVKVYNTEIYRIGNYGTVKGASPMAGIDVEPDAGTFTVFRVYVSYTNIYDTTGYGVIANTTPNPFGRLQVEFLDMYKCNIETPAVNKCSARWTTFNFVPKYNEQGNYMGVTLFRLFAYNCNYNIDLGGKTLYIEEGRMGNCHVTGVDNTRVGGCGNLQIQSTMLYDNVFENLTGDNTFTNGGNATKQFGILFGIGGKTLDAETKSNKFVNCALYVRGENHLSGSIIDNSYALFRYSMTIDGLTAINSTLRAESNSYILLGAPTITNCTILLPNRFVFV